jgi:predicted O-methyltransferase YrrM
MRLTSRSAYACTLAVAVAAVAGFVAGGPALAGYALLSVGLCCAFVVLWRRSAAAQRSQAAAAARNEQRLGELIERIDRLGERHDERHRELAERLDRITEHVGAVAIQTDAASQAVKEQDEALRERIEAVHGDVRSIPAKTRRLVREWNRMVYAEIEDLTALYRDIEPDRALPPLHGWAAGPDLARYLYRQVVEHQRTRVLECGSGSTTVILAYAMRSLGRGHVHALEHDPQFAAATRRMLEDRGLEAWATVVDAPLREIGLDGTAWRWYDPEAVPATAIDLLLVDGPPGGTGPQARYPALPVLADRLSEHALVILDDTRRDDEHRIGERWAAEFDGWKLTSLSHDHGTLVLSREAKPED